MDLGRFRFAQSALGALGLLASALPATAERLPIYCFGVGDGLADSRVQAILPDARGFLWVGTGEGLSRFDGARFATWGRGDGLDLPEIRAIAESPDGGLWLATAGGLYRVAGDASFAPGAGAPLFERIPVEPGRPEAPVAGLLYDPARDELWVATFGGLYRARPTMEAPATGSATGSAKPAARPAGLAFTRVAARPFADPPWSALALGPQGRLYVGAGEDLLEVDGDAVRRHPVPRGPSDGPRGPEGGPDQDPVGGGAIAALAAAGERLLVASGERVLRFDPSRGTFAPLPGAVSEEPVQALLARPQGEILVATRAGLLELQAGRERRIGRGRGLAGDDLLALAADSYGNTWIGTAGAGLCRWPAEDLASFGPADGLAEPELDQIVEEHGRIRVRQAGGGWLEDDGGRFVPVASPPATEDPPAAVSGAGGFSYFVSPAAGLIRRSPAGAEERVPLPPPAAGAEIAGLAAGADGALWLALPGYGLGLLARPAAADPLFRLFSTADGLASDEIRALCADRQNHLWLGSGRGLDLFEPGSPPRLRHFTTRDGLAGDAVRDLLCAAGGSVWIATATGLTRLKSAGRLDEGPPPVYLTGIARAGEALALPPTGLRRYPGVLRLPEDAHLEVDFVGLDFAPGAVLEYEYRLEPDAPWVAAGERRSLTLAHLASGFYRLEVRARAGGEPSAEPARLEIHVAPPFWQRREVGWTLFALVALGAFLLHRARLARALTRERIRRQIAGDLHDELGAGLVQIAIRGEVGKRAGPAAAAAALGDIAGLARELRQAMSDIVWALDPRRDDLGSLVARWRQTALDLFDSEKTTAEIAAPPEAAANLPLDPDLRRHLFLFGKEALANAARHAEAAVVRLRVELAPGLLRLEIEDDGRGFDPALFAAASGRHPAPSRGHGLETLRHRAAALGAKLELVTAPGRGVRWRLEAPLRRRLFPLPDPPPAR